MKQIWRSRFPQGYREKPISEWILPNKEELAELLSRKTTVAPGLDLKPPRYSLRRRVRDVFLRAKRRVGAWTFNGIHGRRILREKLAEQTECTHSLQKRVEGYESDAPRLHGFYRAWCRAEGVPWDGADGVDPSLYSKELREFSEFLRYPQDCDTSEVYPHIENPAPDAMWLKA